MEELAVAQKAPRRHLARVGACEMSAQRSVVGSKVGCQVGQGPAGNQARTALFLRTPSGMSLLTFLHPYSGTRRERLQTTRHPCEGSKDDIPAHGPAPDSSAVRV